MSEVWMSGEYRLLVVLLQGCDEELQLGPQLQPQALPPLSHLLLSHLTLSLLQHLWREGLRHAGHTTTIANTNLGSHSKSLNRKCETMSKDISTTLNSSNNISVKNANTAITNGKYKYKVLVSMNVCEGAVPDAAG